MAASPSIVCGRKNCSGCGRWLHIVEFHPKQREPHLLLQSQCKRCSAAIGRRYRREHPEKVAEHTRRWRQKNLEEDRRKGREYQARRRKDPRTKPVIREQARANWERMRNDPERWARRLAKQREDYAKRLDDPEKAARIRAAQRARYHEHGGKEAMQARRAAGRLRKQFAQILTEALRVELERRERKARHLREVKRAWYQRVVMVRRERWERGEFDDLPPVYGNGHDGPELQRLPARPLSDWIKRQYGTVEGLADEVNMLPRALLRYTNGEAVTVGLEIIDAITTRTGTLLLDIYDPAVYPDLYEPPPTNGNGKK